MWDYELEDGIVVVKATERFDAREFAKVINEASRCVIGKELLFLFDTSGICFEPHLAESTSVSFLLEFLRRKRRLKGAIVVDNPSKEGKAVVATITDAVRGMDTRVFHTREEAVAWLKADRLVP